MMGNGHVLALSQPETPEERAYDLSNTNSDTPGYNASISCWKWNVHVTSVLKIENLKNWK